MIRKLKQAATAVKNKVSDACTTAVVLGVVVFCAVTKKNLRITG